MPYVFNALDPVDSTETPDASPTVSTTSRVRPLPRSPILRMMQGAIPLYINIPVVPLTGMWSDATEAMMLRAFGSPGARPPREHINTSAKLHVALRELLEHHARYMAGSER